jgi:hypothetical protein
MQYIMHCIGILIFVHCIWVAHIDFRLVNTVTVVLIGRFQCNQLTDDLFVPQFNSIAICQQCLD